MSEKPLAFVDLDGTLFRTKKRIPESDRKYTATIDRNGKPSSYMTEQQYRLFQWFVTNTHLIPTTGRDEEEFARVLIPFPNHEKILCFGACIYTEHGQDLEWKKHVVDILHGTKQAFITLKNHCEKTFPNATIQINTIYGLPYALFLREQNAKRTFNLDTQLPLTQHECGTDSVYFYPKGLGKEYAVQYLLRSYRAKDPGIPCLGFADQTSDIPYLSLCDVYMTPNWSNIACI